MSNIPIAKGEKRNLLRRKEKWYLMFLNQWDATINARAYGRSHREYTRKQEISSPTISLEV